jgi:hypothetical protein
MATEPQPHTPTVNTRIYALDTGGNARDDRRGAISNEGGVATGGRAREQN